MYITGGNDRLLKFFTKAHDLPDIFPEIFLRVYRILGIPQHKTVVAQWLNLQIVVEIHDSRHFLAGRSSKNCLVQFSCLAGRAYDQTFPVFIQKTLGNPRSSGKIFKM